MSDIAVCRQRGSEEEKECCRGRKSVRGETCLSCGKIKLTEGRSSRESLSVCVCVGEGETCRLNENIAFGLQIEREREREGKGTQDGGQQLCGILK